jgi:hypothetical protein
MVAIRKEDGTENELAVREEWVIAEGKVSSHRVAALGVGNVNQISKRADRHSV